MPNSEYDVLIQQYVSEGGGLYNKMQSLCKSLEHYTHTYFWGSYGWLDMPCEEEVIFTDLDKLIKNFKKAISDFKLKEKKLEKLETAYAKLLKDLWLALQDKLRGYAIYHTYGCQIRLMQWVGSVFLAG